MTKELKWRLSKLPTSDEVLKLVSDKIITKEEAREILFNETEITERDVKSLEVEIKFLREIIDKLANKSQIIETIRYVQPHYSTYTWTTPYVTYCSSSTQTSAGSSGTTFATSGASAGANTHYKGISDVSTF